LVDTSIIKTICAKKRKFSTYKKMNGEYLYMENSSIFKVLGVGKVIIKMTFKKLITLNNVLHMANIRINLIVVDINFLNTNQVLRIFILILSWNQKVLYFLKICFLLKKYMKIIHFKERLRLVQVVIINWKMMKLIWEGVKR
jgi:hypothetical protein